MNKWSVTQVFSRKMIGYTNSQWKSAVMHNFSIEKVSVTQFFITKNGQLHKFLMKRWPVTQIFNGKVVGYRHF